MDLDDEELKDTKRIKEKTADEMFKELGYKKDINELGHLYYYGKNGIIRFSINEKMIDKLNWISMQELKVINKKVEELGWN